MKVAVLMSSPVPGQVSPVVGTALTWMPAETDLVSSAQTQNSGL